MTRAIQQTVFLKAPPAELFDSFLDSRRHSAITGAPAKLGRRVGDKFTAFDGELLGRNLLVMPKQMIVQAWRSSAWKNGDPDSILVVRFEKTKTGAAAHLAHVGVPPYDHNGVTKGWKHYYWEPWKKYLAQKR